MNRRACTGLLLLALAVPAGAEIYTWTDAAGRVHFGDKPKDKAVQAQAVEVRDYKPGSDAGTRDIIERRERLMNADADKSRRVDGDAARQAALKARDGKRCAEARDHLRKISGRVAFHDDDGRPVHVSEQARAARQRELDDWIRGHCPPP